MEQFNFNILQKKSMNLPPIVIELVKAQDNFDSTSYANCFTGTAVVVDEGKTYTGKEEIKSWIDKANTEYQISMKPLEFEQKAKILKAEISGKFPGSPAILFYHMNLTHGLIQSLTITS
ncbi:nuclear transport factor 2 family protein [Algoriphagus sp.]|uniref:nuclear transport factor 2 family protein n=1 Tax=Algoriphagus sp. TaxID=1872435 RepID=UPI002610D872|nr:nuclear transport factor 2 family protein [Algoriphagus sp.]